MLLDYTNKTVLITGGTAGIGLETALEFARHGAKSIITYRWGSTELDTIVEKFNRETLPKPIMIQSDVGNVDDINELLAELKTQFSQIDAFISNVAFGQLTKDFDSYDLNALLRSIDYSVWPIVEYTRKIGELFGKYPRYIVGISSNGPDQYHTNYDFVAACKALLETIIKYMNYHFFNEPVNINMVRTRFVKTDSLWATFGREFEEFAEKYQTQGLFIQPEEVAKGIFALCSGLMDGVSGQTICLDKGSTFADNIMRFYDNKELFNL